MEKKKNIQKHKNHYYACALAEHATVNYVYFELSNFLFLCAEYEKKPLDVLKEKRNITARSPYDDLDPPDLMTYVLCIFF